MLDTFNELLGLRNKYIRHHSNFRIVNTKSQQRIMPLHNSIHLHPEQQNTLTLQFVHNTKLPNIFHFVSSNNRKAKRNEFKLIQ